MSGPASGPHPAEPPGMLVSADDPAQPAFAETWQAEAYAMVTALVEAGLISPAEWSEALGRAIVAAQAAGDPDLGSTYYEHWMAALEELVVAKGLVPLDDIDQRQGEWRRAYLNTPHGHPVELSAGRWVDPGP